jgi:hypothetical protein
LGRGGAERDLAGRAQPIDERPNATSLFGVEGSGRFYATAAMTPTAITFDPSAMVVGTAIDLSAMKQSG